MWHKVKGLEKVQIGALAPLIMVEPNKTKGYMISWKTSDGLFHLFPFELFLNTVIEKNLLFTVWENT